MEKVAVKLQMHQAYARMGKNGKPRIGKRYLLGKPIVPVKLEIDIGDDVIMIQSKVKLITRNQEEVELNRLIFDAVAGVLERMTRSSMKDEIYEMREASLITQIITPNLRNLDVIIRDKRESLTPASDSIDPKGADHE